MRLPAAIVAIMAVTSPTQAHDWYSDRHDPVFRNACCGGTDCAPLDVKFVTIEDAGFRVRMTADQGKAINPYRWTDVDALIEWDRVQVSEDGRYHICLKPTNIPSDTHHGVWCFFAPPST